MSEVIYDRADRILAFLQECENNGWDLDSSDVSSVLSMDFESIRKSNTVAESFDTVDEAIEALHHYPSVEDEKK